MSPKLLVLRYEWRKCPHESTVCIAVSEHGALFTVHYGPRRVIAVMKFKPQALARCGNAFRDDKFARQDAVGS